MLTDDLAALRALVKEVGIQSLSCSCLGCKVLESLFPAAREALERMEAASAQSARDVVYWRRRAESAEMLAVWQEVMRKRGPIIQGDAATTALEGRDE